MTRCVLPQRVSQAFEHPGWHLTPGNCQDSRAVYMSFTWRHPCVHDPIPYLTGHPPSQTLAFHPNNRRSTKLSVMVSLSSPPDHPVCLWLQLLMIRPWNNPFHLSRSHSGFLFRCLVQEMESHDRLVRSCSNLYFPGAQHSSFHIQWIGKNWPYEAFDIAR